MSINKAPLYAPLCNDDKIVTREWSLFFQDVANGDAGQLWTPTFSGLTGTATITGRWYYILRNLQYFNIKIVPNTNTSSTAGTTYVSNWVTQIATDSSVDVVNSTTFASIGSGVASASNNRIYMPSWTTVTGTITITGIIQGA